MTNVYGFLKNKYILLKIFKHNILPIYKIQISNNEHYTTPTVILIVLLYAMMYGRERYFNIKYIYIIIC